MNLEELVERLISIREDDVVNNSKLPVQQYEFLPDCSCCFPCDCGDVELVEIAIVNKFTNGIVLL